MEGKREHAMRRGGSRGDKKGGMEEDEGRIEFEERKRKKRRATRKMGGG